MTRRSGSAQARASASPAFSPEVPALRAKRRVSASVCAAKSSWPCTPLILKRRYSFGARRPSIATVSEATVKEPWIVETSVHSMRVGALGRFRATERAERAASARSRSASSSASLRISPSSAFRSARRRMRTRSPRSGTRSSTLPSRRAVRKPSSSGSPIGSAVAIDGGISPARA